MRILLVDPGRAVQRVMAQLVDKAATTSPLSAISKDALDERKHDSRPTQEMEGSITVLHINRIFLQ